MPADVSVIIPVFNEADNILPLANETIAALDTQDRSFQVVFVDDASTDATWRTIAHAHAIDARVIGLRHERNAGQSAAVWTGIQATLSPIIATLDGDCQNDPADLPAMLAHLDQYDFVSGKRVKRNDSWVRKVSSRVARWARKTALGVDFSDTGCGIRACKRTSLAGVFAFNGVHRFLPVIVHGNGSRTLEMPVNHRARLAGVSKYGVWNRLWRGIHDLFAIAWYQKRRLNPVPYQRLEAGE